MLYKQTSSGFWWIKIMWDGRVIRKSTKQKNKKEAQKVEAAFRTGLANGKFGIEERESAPTLQEFAPKFMAAIETRCAAKPRTVEFYREKLKRLLEYRPIASLRLDQIEEAIIERYVQERRKTVSPATVNRQLATLRRLLRLAYDWKVINRVPRIKLLPGERNREFVLSQRQEQAYLVAAPEPLRKVALLILDTGLRVGEALNLRWSDIHLNPGPGARYGYLQVQTGKSRNARRTVSITGRVHQMLVEPARSESEWVFEAPSGQPYVGTSLNHQHQRVRKALKLPEDFVIHSLRHTMLTRLGEAGVDAFTIMRIAGHSSITVSQRYVHPSSEAVERAFEKLESLNEAGRPEVGINLGIPADSSTCHTTVKLLN